MTDEQTRALSLYIHIPFCRRKCGYCDFISFAGAESAYTDYTRALIRDIAASAAYYGRRDIRTVFIGGGTPSVLPSSHIRAILEAIRVGFELNDGAEISMEANPESLSPDKLRELRNAGVNRLSMGVQSLNDHLLGRIGRIHTAERAEAAFAEARAAGFDNINLDLMFALPGQTLEDWDFSLRRVIAMEPEHISCYSLTLEENSAMGRENPQLPGDEADRAMYRLAICLLGENGWRQYEISNFARDGNACRHNIIYWTGGEYLGLGLAAHSLMDRRRFHRTEDLKEYLAGDFAPRDAETLSPSDAMAEFMFLGLRMKSGVSAEDFAARFGTGLFDAYGRQIRGLSDKGLLHAAGGRIRLTETGMDLANRVFMEFLP